MEKTINEETDSLKEGEVVVLARPTRRGNFFCKYQDRYFYLSAKGEFLGHTYVGEWNWAASEWNRKSTDKVIQLPSQVRAIITQAVCF